MIEWSASLGTAGLSKRPFHLIEQLAPHHAAIHHHRLLPIRRHDGPGIHPRVDLVNLATQHPAIHQHRQLRRRDVDHRRSRLKLRVEWLDSEKGKQREKSADHGPQNTWANMNFRFQPSQKSNYPKSNSSSCSGSSTSLGAFSIFPFRASIVPSENSVRS